MCKEKEKKEKTKQDKRELRYFFFQRGGGKFKCQLQIRSTQWNLLCDVFQKQKWAKPEFYLEDKYCSLMATKAF